MKKLVVTIALCASGVSYTQTSCECFGSGKDVVVLDAGMGGWSIMYKPLATYLEKEFKVCLIDRDGYHDYSKTEKRDAETIAKELNKAIESQGINDSVILIGHSFGGLNVRVFQKMFPEKVKAMILLDATHPKQFERLPKDFKELKEEQPKQLQRVEKIASKDHLKYSLKSIPTFGLPEEYLEAYYWVTTKAFYYNTYLKELADFDESMEQVSTIEVPIQIPLLVISAKNSMDNESMPGKNKKYPFKEHNETWLLLQEELTKTSTNCRWELVDGNHYFFVKTPEKTAAFIIDFLKS